MIYSNETPINMDKHSNSLVGVLALPPSLIRK